MADTFDDMEFWLPPQFLSENDDVVFNNNGNNKRDLGFMYREGSFGSGKFGFGDSDLSSPVDSVVSSTDSDRNDEEYFVSLTRQMKNSSIDESKAFATANFHRKAGCRVGCSCGHGSSHGSPTGPLKAASSPETWNLLCEAAGEVAKMRIDGTPARKPSPIPVLPKSSNRDFDYQFNQSVYQQQLQAIRFQQMELVLKMKQQKQALWEEQVRANLIQRQQQLIAQQNKMNLSPVTWPPLKPHQNNKSGMRAVYLGHPQVKKECAGTGVFLPRRGNNPPDLRKKATTCPTALLPDRVVQALNLTLPDFNTSSPPPPQQPQILPHFGCGLNSETDPSMRTRNINNLFLQAQKNRHQQIRTQPAVNHEIKLPQEWTY